MTPPHDLHGSEWLARSLKLSLEEMLAAKTRCACVCGYYVRCLCVVCVVCVPALPQCPRWARAAWVPHTAFSPVCVAVRGGGTVGACTAAWSLLAVALSQTATAQLAATASVGPQSRSIFNLCGSCRSDCGPFHPPAHGATPRRMLFFSGGILPDVADYS